MSNGEIIEDEEEFVDELKPGTELMLGQYTIDSFLAAGGFGITYLAKDSLDRHVVIKECFPGSFCRRQNHSVMPRSRAHQNELKSIVRMFSQEAMSLSKAGHPNVVGVHQVFEENNTAYMALDYVRGHDLLEILSENPESLTPDLVQGYLTKVLSAIGHVHDQGILHRDISPDNIIISDSGEPVLIDFGAAREEAGGKASRLLSALRVVKDGYSPQEFYIAGSEQGPSCDLYSLAASFYHIITGDLPPDSQTRLTNFAANEPDPYVPLATLDMGYPQEFSTALDKAMSVLPKERMQDAAEWLAHLSGEVTETATASASAASEGKQDSKSKMPLLLGGVAVAAAAGVGFIMVGAPTGEPEETVAETTVSPTAPAPTQPNEEEVAETEIPNVVEEEVVEAPAARNNEEDVVDEEAVAATPDGEQTVEVAPAGEEDVAVTTEPEIEEEDVAETTSPSDVEAEEVAIAVDEAEATPEEPVLALNLPATPPKARPPGPSNIIVQTAAINLPDTDLVEIDVPEAPVVSEQTDISRDTVQLAAVAPDVAPVVDVVAPAALPEPAPEPEPEIVVVEPEIEPETPVADVAADSILTAESNWSVRMPFAASETDASVVGEVYLSAWGWLQEGVEISSVNGISIDDIDMIPLVLRQTSNVSDKTQLDVLLAAGFDDSAPIEHQIILPVIQETTLKDGLRFETTFRNGVWQTVVTDIGRADTTLQPGDLVIEHLTTNTRMTGRTSLANAIDEAQSKDLPLLVSRDGDVLEAGLGNTTSGGTPNATAETQITVDDTALIVESADRSLPFTLEPNTPKTVATVQEGAPFWLVPGLEIATVDGTVVDSNEQILSLIEATEGASVQIGVDALFTAAVIERPLLIASEIETILQNGLTFSTSTTNVGSVTEVTNVPEGSGLRVGDTLVAYVATSEMLDGTISIKELLEREIAAGTTSMSFAVKRDGEVWIEALNLATLTE